jgi:hypothetical protein
MDSRVRGNDKNDALFLETAQAPRGYKKNGWLAIANQPIVVDYLLLTRAITGSF